MKQFHDLAGLANKNVYASICRIQTNATDFTAHAVYSYSHVTWMLSHDNPIAFI